MLVFAQEQMAVFAIAHHIDSGRHPLTCFQDVPNTPYSTTLLRNLSRSFFRVSSTSATASGGIQPVVHLVVALWAPRKPHVLIGIEREAVTRGLLAQLCCGLLFPTCHCYVATP